VEKGRLGAKQAHDSPAEGVGGPSANAGEALDAGPRKNWQGFAVDSEEESGILKALSSRGGQRGQRAMLADAGKRALDGARKKGAMKMKMKHQAKAALRATTLRAALAAGVFSLGCGAAWAQSTTQAPTTTTSQGTSSDAMDSTYLQNTQVDASTIYQPGSTTTGGSSGSGTNEGGGPN